MKPVPVSAWSLTTGERINFPSILAANDEGGFTRTNIQKALGDLRRSHAGYIWLKQDVRLCDVCVFKAAMEEKK